MKVPFFTNFVLMLRFLFKNFVIFRILGVCVVVLLIFAFFASRNQNIGIASWYGRKTHGRRTASGEVYDKWEFTAAHRTLPFETMVKISNLENGKEAVVRINDRGPYKFNRIIDVSYATAGKLRMIEKGTARVKIEIIKTKMDVR